jgi:predicted ATPase/DNA-binding SARP family transcriptional activator
VDPGAVTVSLLGPLKASSALGDATLGGPRQRCVLAALALAAPDAVSIDRLVDGLWGQDPPANPKATLQVFVHHLRKALAAVSPEGAGPAIVRRDPGYVLDDTVAVDVQHYTALRARARGQAEAGDSAAAASLLDQALSLWRGPALADLREFPFAEADAARLDEEQLLAQEDLVDLGLDLGEHESLVPALEERVRLHPTRERLWGQLMVALYRANRQADALSSYARARDRLAEELGIDPGAALRQLELAILRQDPTLSAPEKTRTVPPPRSATRVPVPLTGTVGREEQLDELVRAIAGSARLITLTGVGGTGKTRLAVVLAQRATATGPAGCAFFSLADVTDAHQMVGQLFRHFVPHETPPESLEEAVERIGEALDDEPGLVVLDNVEQINGASSAVRGLLQAGPGLTVVATSRLPLRIEGEHEWPVGPLDESAAVRLFCERARAASPGFEPGDEDLAAIARLTEVLDRLPLAIELAAARAALVPPGQMLRFLERDLGLLATTSSAVPDRHRAIATTMRWSLERLSRDALALARLLAGTEGPFTVEAAEAVGRSLPGEPRVLECLAELLGASLVRNVDSRVELRFELLRTAAVMLRDDADDEDERRLDAFCGWLVAHAAAWPDELATASADLAMGRFDDEQLHLEWALRRTAARPGGAPQAADLVAVLHDYWIASGQALRGEGMIRAVLEGDALTVLDRARCLCALGKLAYQSTDWARAEAHLREAEVALQGSAEPQASHLGAVIGCYLGGCLVVTDRVDEGAALAGAALGTAREIGNYEVQAVGLSMLAIAAAIRGDFEAEAGYYRERLGLVRGHGDRARTADTLNTLAEIALDDGDAEAAREWATESLEMAADRFPLERRDATISLARTQILEGDRSAAARTAETALELSLATGQHLGIAQSWRVAGCLAGPDLARDAVRLFAAAQTLRPSPSGTDEPIERDLAGHLARLREVLGPAASERAWLSGTVLSPEDATRLAREIVAAAPPSLRSSAGATRSTR